MIIIQAEDGAIIMDPKEIYIDKDLDGNLHLYADLSSTDRVKAVELTVNDYSEAILDHTLNCLCKDIDDWLFTNEQRHYLIRMDDMMDMYTGRAYD